ncbi:MAG: protein kinase [Myxococcota bacterium]
MATKPLSSTPEYMSPEQARGAPVTGASDLYSYGVVLYEMLTGSLPFTGGTTDLIFKHLREVPPRVRARNPDVPDVLDTLVMELLEKEPERRMRSAHELMERSKAWLSEHPLELREHTQGRPSTPPVPAAMQLAERWRSRFEGFRAMAGEVHSDGGPAWLVASLASMGEAVAELESVGDALADRARVFSQREEDTRATRLRLGHAIDALAADHGHVMTELATMPSRVAEGAARVRQLDPALAKAWKRAVNELGPQAPEGVDSLGALWSESGLEALRELGTLAGTLADARRAVRGADADRARLQHQRDDLAFQIAQMKGRLAALAAAVDVDQDDLREETKVLDARWETALNAIAFAASKIIDHLMDFEELQPRLRS